MKTNCCDIKLPEITECKCDYRAPEEMFGFDGETLYKENVPYAKVVSREGDMVTLETIHGIKQTIRISLIKIEDE